MCGTENLGELGHLPKPRLLSGKPQHLRGGFGSSPTAETSWKCGSTGKAARWAQGAAEIGAAQLGSSVPAELLLGGPRPLPALFQQAEWARERKWASEAPTKLDCALRSRA